MEGYLLDAVKVYGNNTAQYLYHSFWTLLDDPREGSCPDGMAQKQRGVCGGGIAGMSTEIQHLFGTDTNYCHMFKLDTSRKQTDSRAVKKAILDGSVSVKERCLIHPITAPCRLGTCDLEPCPVAGRFAWRGLGSDQDSRDYAVRRPSTSSHQLSTPSPAFLPRPPLPPLAP